MKFLFIVDRHNGEKIPSSRKDKEDFLLHCAKKDDEIIKLAKDNHVAAILHPGDFWTDADRKPNNEFIVSVCNKWMNIFDNNRHIPVVGIAGNHDLIGENNASLAHTTAGMLDSLGILSLIKQDEIKTFIDEDGTTIAITAAPYHKGMDTVAYLKDYLPEPVDADIHIHIVHGMLEKNSLGKLIKHTCIDTILDTSADITLSGHDHNGFGIVKKDGKWFVNPGAVVRMNCDEKEMNRTVSVALIEIENKNIKIELIPLKSVLPANDVLDRKEIEARHANAKFSEEIKAKAEAFKIGNKTEFEDILDEICGESKISNEMRQKIEADVNAKMTSATIKVIPKSGTKIKSIKLHNFQSHQDSEICFDPHFNAITGESRNGKSAILRALRWIIENKPSGKNFIRTGRNEASAEIKLENGTIIRRYVNDRDNGYKFFMPDGTVEDGNTKAVSRAQELLGFSSLEIEGISTPIPLNFLKQGDSWYLIGDKYSGTDRARIIGALKNTNTLDLLVKELERTSAGLVQKEKNNCIEIANLKLEEDDLQKKIEINQKIEELLQKQLLIQKIEQYIEQKKQLDSQLELCNRISAQFNEVTASQLIRNAEKLNDTIVRIQDDFAIIKNNRHILAKSQSILNCTASSELAQMQLLNTKELLRKLNSVKNQQAIVTEQKAKLNDSLRILTATVASDEASTCLANVNKTIDKLTAAEEAFNVIKKAQIAIKKAEEVIPVTEIISTYEEAKAEILEHTTKAKNVEELTAIIKKETDRKLISEKNIKVHERVLDEQIDQWTKIFTENHICPTCYSTINEEQAEIMADRIRNEE